MQTFIAHALKAGTAPAVVQEGLERVERWYGRLWGEAAVRRDAGAGVGVHLWDVPRRACRWPAWSSRAGTTTVTLYVPLGAERLIGDVEPEHAPAPLVDRLLAHPGDVLELTGPFVLARLHEGQDERELALFTDALGVGRLFELQVPTGTVWSNRPVAALRFAGVRAQPDELAWQRMAGCDWPMGEATPYAGVRTVPAATSVRATAGSLEHSTVDLLAELVRTRTADPGAPGSLAATAEALRDTARSVSRLWPERPTLSLSGGRDSRLVAAAFVAAGVDVAFTTNGGLAGEADTARRLLAALPRAYEHRVTSPSGARPASPAGGVLARARAWHDVVEGLRPAHYVRNDPPRALPGGSSRPKVSGAGGDLAHGPLFPSDAVQIEQDLTGRLTAWRGSLLARVLLPRGVAAAAVGAVEQQVDAVLAGAAARGLTDSRALTWFYLNERVRRWGLSGESAAKVLPLLTPQFVRAAFGLNAAQSRASELHASLIAELVPQWAGVPFFRATLKQREAAPQRRLWQEPDRDLVTGLLARPDAWGDAFDIPTVQRVWRQACAGRAAARDELLLQRVVWRAAFDDHLRAINGERPVTRRPVPLERLGRPRVDVARAARAFAAHANDVPTARRLARTRLGRYVRRHLGV